MEVYKFEGHLYGVSGPYGEKEAIRAAGAKWNAKRGRWECGPDEAARALLMGANASEFVRKDLSVYAERLQDMLELSQATEMAESVGSDVPSSPNCDYYPYQKTAVRYIEETGGRCLVADDMAWARPWKP